METNERVCHEEMMLNERQFNEDKRKVSSCKKTNGWRLTMGAKNKDIKDKLKGNKAAENYSVKWTSRQPREKRWVVINK